MQVIRTDAQTDAWFALRTQLWTHPADEHRTEMAAMLAAPQVFAVFLALDDAATVGFAEASLRTDYVNGCTTSPVAFLEGIYVAPEFRRRGIARALADAVVAWARTHGCTELASDALLDNPESHAMHGALGFAETERVVYFRRAL